ARGLRPRRSHVLTNGEVPAPAVLSGVSRTDPTSPQTGFSPALYRNGLRPHLEPEGVSLSPPLGGRPAIRSNCGFVVPPWSGGVLDHKAPVATDRPVAWHPPLRVSRPFVGLE